MTVVSLGNYDWIVAKENIIGWDSGSTNFVGAFAASAGLLRDLKNPELAGFFAVAVAVVLVGGGPVVDIPTLDVVADFFSPTLEDGPFLAGTEGAADLGGGLGFGIGFRTSPIETFFAALVGGPFPTSSMVLLTPALRLLLASFFTTPEDATVFGLSALLVPAAFFASRSVRDLSRSRCWKRVMIWLANSRDLSSSDFL